MDTPNFATPAQYVQHLRLFPFEEFDTLPEGYMLVRINDLSLHPVFQSGDCAVIHPGRPAWPSEGCLYLFGYGAIRQIVHGPLGYGTAALNRPASASEAREWVRLGRPMFGCDGWMKTAQDYAPLIAGSVVGRLRPALAQLLCAGFPATSPSLQIRSAA